MPVCTRRRDHWLVVDLEVSISLLLPAGFIRSNGRMKRKALQDWRLRFEEQYDSSVDYKEMHDNERARLSVDVGIHVYSMLCVYVCESYCNDNV